MATIGEMLVRVGLDTAQFDREMRNVSKGLDALESGLQSAGTALTAGITVPLMGLATGSLMASARIESLRMGLDSIAGSSEETARQFERLTELARLPGMGLPEVAQASINLQAAGVSAEEAERWIAAFGNAVASVGKGAPDLGAVVVQLQQMANKSSVLANDLRPIMERVPQLGVAIRETFGTLDTEVLSKTLTKMGMDTRDFIAWMVEELEKLPPVTGGLSNAFENISDSVVIAAAKIGDILAPVVIALTPHIEALLDWVVKAAEWFASLPVEIQLTVGAVVAFAAALGPLMLIASQMIGAFSTFAPLLTGIAGSLGVAGGAAGLLAVAFGPVTLAIGGAAAALGALYVVSEDARAAFGMWGDAIGGILGQLPILAANVWDLIAALGSSVIGDFLGLIMDMVGWVMKLSAAIMTLPLEMLGQSLREINMHLSGLNDHQKTLREETDKATRSVTDHAKKLADAALAGKDLRVETGAMAKEQSAAEKAAIALDKALKEQQAKAKTAAAQAAALAEKTKILKEEQERARKVAEFYTEKIQAMTRDKKVLAQEFDKFRQTVMPQFIATLMDGKAAWDENTKAIVALQPKLHDMTASVMPGIVAETLKMETALKTLGMTSASEYAKITADAQTAYDALVASDKTTQFQRDSAYLKVLKAMADESKAVSGQIPQDLQGALDEMERKVNGPSGLAKVKKPFQDFDREVSTIVTNLAQDLSKSLFDGNLSFAERMKKSLKDLGAAAVSQFIQPFLNAIVGPEGLITKGINKLIDKLFDLDGILGKVFGGATSGISSTVGGTAGSAAGVAGGAAGQVAGAAGSGLAGVIGAIGSVATAISSIIGNFQMAGMNKSLDLIETAVRRLDIATTQNGDWNILLNTGHIRSGVYYLVDGIEHFLIPFVESIKNNTHWMLGKIESPGGVVDLLHQIGQSAYWSLAKLEDINFWMPNIMGRMEQSLQAMLHQEHMVQVNVYLDSRLIQQELGRAAALQGA